VLPCAAATLVLLLTLNWELPWYLIWLLPFAALARKRRFRIVAIVLGVYMFISWMPYATTFERDLGLHPQTTIVGRTDARFLHTLLY
jgi:alpha-1,6-mannosyltransferase